MPTRRSGATQLPALRLFDSDEDAGDEPPASGQDSADDASDDAADFDPRDPVGLLRQAARSGTARLRRGDLADDMESCGRPDYMAKEYIMNVLRSSGGTSVLRVFRDDVSFASERNRRECLALARIVDAALHGDVKQVLELAVRRLAGVHTADSSNGNWSACDAIEQVMSRQSFLPTHVLQRTLKTVVQMNALQQKHSDLGPTGKGKQSQAGRASRPKTARSSSGNINGAAAPSGQKPTRASSTKE